MEIVTTTRWPEYYKLKVSHFGERDKSYRRALNYLVQQTPDFLSPRDGKTFLLGGFHPSRGTPQDFIDFCRNLHPNPKDKHLFIDINYQPVRMLRKEFTKFRVQAALENLPFSEGSIDMIFLDGTATYMSNEALNSFSQGADKVLSENGVVLVGKPSRWEVLQLIDRYPFIKSYPRTTLEVYESMKVLKLVHFENGYHSSFLGLARWNSGLHAFSPDEFEWGLY